MPSAELPDEVAAVVNAEVQRLMDSATFVQPKGQQAIREHAAIDLWADTSSRAIIQARNEVDAVRLRIKGMDYRSIARQLGIVTASGQPKTSTVHKMVTRALSRWFREETDELRVLELERLERLTERTWKIIEREGGKGDDDRALRAIDRYMQIAQRKHSILGLDAPKQAVFKGEVVAEHSHGGTVNVEHELTRVEAVEEYLRLVDEVVAEEIRRRDAVGAIEATSTVVDDMDIRDDDDDVLQDDDVDEDGGSD